MAEKKCDLCGKIDKIKKLKKVNRILMCKECYFKKRKERREKLWNEEVKNWGIRTKKEIKKDEKFELEKPIIKGSKLRSSGRIKKGMYLTRDEKNMLYYKYKKKEFNSVEANKKVKECSDYLSNFVIKLKEKKLSDEEINRRFKEEFAQLLEKSRNSCH